MPTRKKIAVTRPTKEGGLSTYVQSYSTGNTTNSSISNDIIASIKIQHTVNNKYLLYDYLRSLSPTNLTVNNIYYITSKINSIEDIESLTEFIVNNIDDLNLMVLCGILNNIPVKYEYYLIIFTDVFEKIKVSDDVLYSLIYSLNDHDTVISLLSDSKKFKTRIYNIFNPCNIINLYSNNINYECIHAAINDYNNKDIVLKYLSNNIRLTVTENRIFNSYIKYNNNIIIKKNVKLYMTSFVNISPSVASTIYKKDIDIDVGLYSNGLYEFTDKKADINKYYNKIKNIKITNDSDFIITDSGYYLDDDNRCYLIISLEINRRNVNSFNFITLPSNVMDMKVLDKIMKNNNMKKNTEQLNYNYNKYLVSNK